MRTAHAANTYNILLGEGRRVGAGLDRGGLTSPLGLRSGHAGEFFPLRAAGARGAIATVFSRRCSRRRHMRPALFALYAFDIEIAHVAGAGERAARGRSAAAMVARCRHRYFARAGGGQSGCRRVDRDRSSATSCPNRSFVDLIEAQRDALYRKPVETIGEFEQWAETRRMAASLPWPRGFCPAAAIASSTTIEPPRRDRAALA